MQLERILQLGEQLLVWSSDNVQVCVFVNIMQKLSAFDGFWTDVSTDILFLEYSQFYEVGKVVI